jgi:hypothetical protein
LNKKARQIKQAAGGLLSLAVYLFWLKTNPLKKDRSSGLLLLLKSRYQAIFCRYLLAAV